MSALFKGEEFFLKGGEDAILLLHGFTASTQEVEGLGLALAEEGFTVLAPLLPGHNRNFAEFKKTGAQVYYQWVEEKYRDISHFKAIHVVGLSFGATLALHIAAHHPLGKIVALAPAIFYYDPFASLAPLLQIYRGKVMKRCKTNPDTRIASRWDLFKPEAVRERVAYQWLAFPQLQTTRQLIKEVVRELPTIKNPILIIHSLRDTTTKPQGSQYLYDHIGSKEKKVIFLKQSGHIITEDYEADLVEREVMDFLKG